MENHDDRQTHRISVRNLAEYIYQSGSLSSVSFSGVSGIEGTRMHQRVFADLKKEYQDGEVETEVFFRSSYPQEEFSIEISGRADCIITSSKLHFITDDETNHALSDTPPSTEAQENPSSKMIDSTSPQFVNIIEIKTHNRQVKDVHELIMPSHQAQLMLYAYMYLESHPKVKFITTTLRYVSIQTYESMTEESIVNRRQANAFFRKTMKLYVHVATNIIVNQKKRDTSISSFTFPYEHFRSGQKQFMNEALSCFQQKETLIAEAPTGIGKTISTLYPAIKWLSHAKDAKIFYMTAKTATRDVANKAIRDMRAAGLYIKSIQLASKESLCPCHEIYCDATICKFAKNYYDRLNDALDELFFQEEILPETILRIAKKHELCPHELALDASMHCDVIICDYNHVFNPRVRLQRYFVSSIVNHMLLVDEAHNMVDRSRDMYSATLTRSSFLTAKAAVRGMDRRLDGHFSNLDQYFIMLCYGISKMQPAISSVEDNIDEKEIISAETFRATKKGPRTLYTILWKTCYRLSMILDDIPSGEAKSAILTFFFDARFFLTVIEQFYDDAYIFTCLGDNLHADTPSEMELTMTLSCLDASKYIAKAIKDQHACVFFSATLSPQEYYQSMLVGADRSFARTLQLPSPFPPENLQVVIVKDIKTTYKERSFSANRVKNTILRLTREKRGNFMIFFPSFNYQNMIFDSMYKEIGKMKGISLMRQTQNMSSNEKADYLARFDVHGKDTLLAFAVLGGHFGEGIDLVGDKLSGVFIVGVGLPQIGAERELIRQYCQEAFHDGFSYAYRYPGWEKVLQAAGRVIRDEEDRGFVVLMDERYMQNEYRILFPEHWHPVEYTSEDVVIDSFQ